MKKIGIVSAGILLAAVVLVTASALPALSTAAARHHATAAAHSEGSWENREAQVATRARVSIEDAIKAGRAAAPGIVIAAELESEDTAVTWEVKIVSDTTVREVKIDAVSGQTIGVEVDNDRNEHEGRHEGRHHGEHEGCGEHGSRDRHERGEHEDGERD